MSAVGWFFSGFGTAVLLLAVEMAVTGKRIR